MSAEEDALDEMELEWTDGLCADVIDPVQEAQVQGGPVKVGGQARVLEDVSEDARALAGHAVRVEAIAVGSKGKGAFRKRLWVALRVRDEGGIEARVLATELRVEPV